ncbi:Ig-like domain-containing protein [Methanobrevibacter filiformis]|uniref:Bacterial Ig-like domain protein n=1 Tax=Methanobrevibacter filiformis TaxID=55758 RepID=A0A162FHK3_9EURY|nr:Ig-like domain-containing protein [Methanobrevibacter filiformis]KZX10050.1 bacterial Ig-like domain protein [Methanobrevibacter filiformis]
MKIVKNANSTDDVVFTGTIPANKHMFNITNSEVTFENITLKNINTTFARGGAINIDNSNVTFANCIFENVNGTYGSAVSGYGNLIFINCTFENNYASNSGSSIQATGGPTDIVIKDSTFINNAAVNGGAIFVRNNGSPAKITIENSNFENNNATNGSAIYVAGATNFTVNNSEFNNNGVTGAIGIATGSLSILIFDNTSFTGNTVNVETYTTTGGAKYGGLKGNITGFTGYLPYSYLNATAFNFTINSKNTTVQYGDNITLVAKLNDRDLNLNGLNVSLYKNDSFVSTAKVINGVATFENITATATDTYYAVLNNTEFGFAFIDNQNTNRTKNITVTVNKADLNITLRNETIAKYNETLVLNATVLDQNNNPVTEPIDLTFSIHFNNQTKDINGTVTNGVATANWTIPIPIDSDNLVIFVSYPGNDQYNGYRTEDPLVLNISKINTTITTTNNSTKRGNNVTIIANLTGLSPGDIAGKLIYFYYANNNTEIGHSTTNSNGIAYLNVVKPTEDFQYYAVFNSTILAYENTTSKDSPSNVTILPGDLIINLISIENTTYNSIAIVKATVVDQNGDPIETGLFELWINNVTQSAVNSDNDGNIIFNYNIPDNSATLSFVIKFAGNANYSNSSSNVKIIGVSKLNTTIVNLNNATITSGQKVNITATLKNNKTGEGLANKKVNFYYYGNSTLIDSAFTNSDGFAYLELSPKTSFDYYAEYVPENSQDNLIYNNVTSSVSTINVTPGALSVIRPDDITVPYGSTTLINVTVIGPDGKPVSGLNVTFTFSNDKKADISFNATTNSKGIASVNYTADTYKDVKYWIRYVGNEYQTYDSRTTNDSFNIEVIPVTTVIITGANSTVKKGENFTLFAHLTDANGNPIENASVIFHIIGGMIVPGKATDANGDAVSAYNPIANKNAGDYYEYWVEFRSRINGNNYYYAFAPSNSSLSNVTVVAAKLNITAVNRTIEYNKTVNLTGTILNVQGKPIPGLNVTLYIDGVEIGTFLTDTNGTVNYEYSVGFVNKTYFEYKFVYNGSDYDPASGIAYVNLTKINTTTVITSPTVTNVTEGDEITLTAKLTDKYGNPLEGQEIYFIYENGDILGYATTDANGVASCNVYVYKSGEYHAVFDGDLHYNPSDSDDPVSRFRINIVLSETRPIENETNPDGNGSNSNVTKNDSDVDNDEDSDLDIDGDNGQYTDNSDETQDVKVKAANSAYVTTKATGVPLIAVLFVLLSALGIVSYKKKE